MKIKRNSWILAACLGVVALLFFLPLQANAKKHFSKKAITQVQQQLKELGYYQGEITGSLDENNAEAVKAFQKDHKIQIDGIPGKNTRKALTRAIKQKAAGSTQKKSPPSEKQTKK